MRLLHLLAPACVDVREMTAGTLARLETTCFGRRDGGCRAGECFETGLITLRFLAAVSPGETAWMGGLMDMFRDHWGEKRPQGRHGNGLWYYWLCLAELPFNLAEPELVRYQGSIVAQLTRSAVMNSENDRRYHPVMLSAVRNALSRLPAYTYIRDRQPYMDEKDGRLHFDMTPVAKE